MGDVSKCLDAIVEFFNNDEPLVKPTIDTYMNDVYMEILQEAVDKILALNNEDRIRAFNSDVNDKANGRYKHQYIYDTLTHWKLELVHETTNFLNFRFGTEAEDISIDPENRFYRQGDRVFYEYVKRDRKKNIVDKLTTEIKFSDKISVKKDKENILTADEASLLLNSNVYDLTDEESDNLIKEIMKHKNYDLRSKNIYENISNDMDRRLTAIKFAVHNSNKSSDSYIVNNAMLEDLVKDELEDNKDILNHNEFTITFHCYTDNDNESCFKKSQYSLKHDERWIVTTNVEFDKQKKLILQYVLTSRDGMRTVTLTAKNSKDVFAVKDDNGVWSARENKTRKIECDRLAKNIPLSSNIVYELKYEELPYS